MTEINQWHYCQLGLLTTKFGKVYCWVCQWNFFDISKYVAKSQARTWLSRALSSSFNSVLARRADRLPRVNVRAIDRNFHSMHIDYRRTVAPSGECDGSTCAAAAMQAVATVSRYQLVGRPWCRSMPDVAATRGRRRDRLQREWGCRERTSSKLST